MEEDGGCVICGGYAWMYSRCSIPMHEGMVLPNDWPGEWAGFPACEECHALQGTLSYPVPAWVLRAKRKQAEWAAKE